LGFITAQYAWSLEDQDDLGDFASGLLWQHENNVGGCSLPYFPAEQFVELERRFPPRKVDGLEGFDWHPPRQRNRAKEERRVV
jgi:hypothetical protein